MRTSFAVVSFAAAALLAAPEPAVTGLDHLPIAVRDLARAANDYRALGFALKPGRPHDNGIQNQHVKFTDGTELELIAAPPPDLRLPLESLGFDVAALLRQLAAEHAA